MEAEIVVEPDSPERAQVSATPTRHCGGPSFVPHGPWIDRDDARLEWLAARWHPRGEHGRPQAIREVSGGVEIPGHDLVLVRVANGPTAQVPCYVPRTPPASFTQACGEAESLPQMLREDQPRPADAAQWAELLGTLDRADVSFASAQSWQACATGPALPPEALADLGVSGKPGRETVQWLELFVHDDASRMLVRARFELSGDFAEVHRTELWSDNGGAR
ncbi:MAG: hypothetical protein U0168_11580 [Nannocystaceae bacterium]